MKPKELNKSDFHLELALIETLINRIPPKHKSVHLEDLVKLLMESLSRGEIYLPLDHSYPSIELKGKGWPEEHIKELLKSGWVDNDNSPMALNDNQLSWRRWHNEMNNILDELSRKADEKPMHTSYKQLSNINRDVIALDEQQNLAVQATEKHNLILISGGPGTGYQPPWYDY